MSSGTSKWPKLHKKIATFFVFYCAKPSFRKLVEVWQALSCDRSLYDVIPICHSRPPGFSFGRNNSFVLPCPYPSKSLFLEFSSVVLLKKTIASRKRALTRNWPNLFCFSPRPQNGGRQCEGSPRGKWKICNPQVSKTVIKLICHLSSP